MFYVATDVVHDSIPVLHCRYSMWRTPLKPTAILVDLPSIGPPPSCRIPAVLQSTTVGIRYGGLRRMWAIRDLRPPQLPPFPKSAGAGTPFCCNQNVLVDAALMRITILLQPGEYSIPFVF